MDVPCSALGDNIGVPIAVLFTLIVLLSVANGLVRNGEISGTGAVNTIISCQGHATALDSLIDNNKSFIGKVANDLFRSMNLAQAGLNLDTDDLKQAGNLGLWKAVPKFDAARGMKFLTYAAPALRNAMMDMVRDAFTAFEQRMLTEGKDGVCYQRVLLDDVLPGEEQLRCIEAIADPYAMQPQSIVVV